LSFVDTQGTEENNQQAENAYNNNFIANKLVQDSRIYLQIFIDLVKFASVQKQDNVEQEATLEKFIEQVTNLFEMYIQKT
jgi:hypothetical protein